MFGHPSLTAACAEYEQRLSGLGLLPDAERRAARRRWLALAVLVLVGLSVAKIWVALSRGRTNIAFLIVMTIVAYLARLYLDADARRVFIADPRRAAVAAGLPEADVAALERVDGVGLELTARSLAAKRAGRPRPTWLQRAFDLLRRVRSGQGG